MAKHARASLSLVAAVLLAGVAPVGAGVAIAQDASPGASTGVSSPEGIDPKVAREIDAVVASVPRLRGIEPTASVPYRSIDKATFQTELQGLLAEQMPPELAAAEDALLTRLGLLGPDDDLTAELVQLYADQALAYYDPRTKTITIVGSLDDVGPTQALVFAHEYDHALQDQRWDLEGSRVKDPSQSDAQLAETALTEGDATLLMNDWATSGNLKPTDLIKVAADALSRSDTRLLDRLPPILRFEVVDFPYVYGLAFANAIRGRGTDWDALDAAWDARPSSTEQVLHPERYPKDVPVEITLPDVATALGDGWVTSDTQTLGEGVMGVWVADGKEAPRVLGMPGPMPHADAVEGWGGDRLVSLDGPDGHWAVVWQTAWDSQKDADEFAAAAKTTMKDLDGTNAVRAGSDISGGAPFPVLVLVADGKGTLASVHAALGVG